MSYTFEEFGRGVVARTEMHHPVDSWDASDWATALGGEVGEAASKVLEVLGAALALSAKAGEAQNLVKKLNRLVGGYTQNESKNAPGLYRALEDELGDTLVYLFLLAKRLGIDLEAAAVAKFDAVSDEYGFPRMAELSRPAGPPAGMTHAELEILRKLWDKGPQSGMDWSSTLLAAAADLRARGLVEFSFEDPGEVLTYRITEEGREALPEKGEKA